MKKISCMFRFKVSTKSIFQICPIVKIYGMAPFCKLICRTILVEKLECISMSLAQKRNTEERAYFEPDTTLQSKFQILPVHCRQV